MHRILPFLLSLLLGIGSAALVACGDGGGTKNGIPAGSADDLSGQYEDVQQAVAGDRCDDVPGQLEDLDEGVDGLPESVDNELVDRLRQANQNLRGRAVDECNEAREPRTTEEPETETETQPTVTTVEPEPEPEPEPTETVEPPVEPEPEPDDDGGELEPGEQPPLDQDTVPPGGGVQPEVEP